MPSQRRVRLLAVAVIAILLLTFYYSGDASKIQNQKFYRSTLEAMRAKEEAKQAPKEKIPDPVVKSSSGAVGPKIGDPDVERPAVPAAKEKEGAGEDMEEIPIAGRIKMTVPKNKGVQDSALNAGAPEEVKKSKAWEGEEGGGGDHRAARRKRRAELDSEAGPSKRAKSILLGHYNISPPPFVVELDQHPIGPALQQLLKENTGRGTVPNVLVNGKSIGGGAEMAALDESDELASKLRQLGGKWIAEVTHKNPESG
ncbi:uncharacterized protein N7482_007578 [Penicillium canariense]|uniref:Glutaredoxin domain-containing protein n=1 Tax=Penicillium canariense TaxID=189055 RepID=A0A9W9HX21_9EURO|nr:uncharacterized protein N7482_007578 [Penicillium canariense]KAJ5160574.1 hypothetical protein N7482_007578 [Penicillium canariense]